MKKRFKTIFCIFFSIFMMFAVSCEEPLEIEEYIAQMEEYGEWDGNYMYRGNVKAKTSGEDEELCLPEVIYKDQTYLLDELNDIGEFYYLENDQVLFFANAKLKTDDTTQEQPDNSIESQNYEQENATTLYMLIKYSYKEKSYEIIYAFENINLNNNLKLILLKKIQRS